GARIRRRAARRSGRNLAVGGASHRARCRAGIAGLGCKRRTRMLQRAFDIACAAAGLVLASPLLLVIAALIVVDDGGPVLFTQTRVGAGRPPFRIYKFRTMPGGETTRVVLLPRAAGLQHTLYAVATASVAV